MTSKKKDPNLQQPTLDMRAIDLHNKIGDTEDGVVPLYLELGVVLKGIKEERKFDWKGLITHATETLGLKRARIVRAWRIRKLHESNPEKVNGLTLYEGLQHEPKGKPEPQPVGSPLTSPEYQAANRYEKAVGGKDRAVEVLTRIFINGEKPIKGAGGSGGKRPKLTPIAKIFATKQRGEFRKNPGGFVAGFVGQVVKAEETYTQMTNDAIAAATTEEAKLQLVDVLRNLDQERRHSWSVAREVISKRSVHNFDDDKVKFAKNLERQVNEALGGQSVPSGVPSDK